MRVLFLSYFFPPYAYATGVKRSIRIIKHLKKHGIEPIVISARDYTFIKRDESFLKELPRDLMVLRPRALEPSTFFRGMEIIEESRKKFFRYFIWPDTRILWIINALPQIKKVIKELKPLGIVAQAPPYTSLVLGYISSKLYKVPLFVDLWDPWSDDIYEMYPAIWQKILTEKAEEIIMRAARGIIVVTPPMKYHLLKNYPFLTPEEIEVITFGYEEEEMKEVRDLDYSPPLKILYLGSLFGKHKNPEVFFEAFTEFINEEGVRDIKLILVGTKSKRVVELASKIPEENLELLPYVPHEKVPEFMSNAHVLWLLTSPGPHYDIVIPCKLFEYLGARRPILATVPPGWVQDFLRRINTIVCDPTDKREIKETLKSIWKRFNQKNLPVPPGEIRTFYEYKNLAERYASFLKERLK